MYSPKRRLRLFRNPAFTQTDAIANALTTSLSAYNSANIGSWVSVTSTEYDTVQTTVSNTSIGMATTSLMAASSNGNLLGNSKYISTNVASADCPAIPAGSYVYAAAYRSTLSGQTGIQLYQNTTSNTYSNFTQLGTNLPTSVVGYNYVVLKQSTSNVSTASLVALYTNTAADARFFMYKPPVTVPTSVNARYFETTGPITTSTNIAQTGVGYSVALQTLSTTVKQW